MSISISCIATIRHEDSIRAIESTLKSVDVKKVYWFSDIDFPKDIGCEVLNIKIPQFDLSKSFNETVSHITLKLVPEVVDTDYNLIVQYDGYAINKNGWTNEFLTYDYIGAVVLSFPDKYRVGNGGFSLRSKKLYNALKAIDIKYCLPDLLQSFSEKNIRIQKDKFNGIGVPEDSIISITYRDLLEKEYGIQFAPEHVADRFSIEFNTSSPWLGKSFGFHGRTIPKLKDSIFFSLFNKSF